jgi:ParB family chromosome partitioning protein
MGEAELAELAQSIAAKGILQPLLVRRRDDDPSSFEIIAGERRWRAAQLAQLHEVPVLVRELSDAEALEVALVENLQRQDLNPLEEAEGYRRLMAEFEHTQEELARVVGKSRSHIANSLRLLSLPEPVRALIDDGALTAGHARALVTAADPIALARQVVDAGLSVRATEALARSEKPPIPAGKPRQVMPPGKDPNTAALERDLSQVLGLAVEIRFRGQGGALILHYRTLDQLDDILMRLNRSNPAPTVASARSASPLLPADDPGAGWAADIDVPPTDGPDVDTDPAAASPERPA